MNLERQIKAKKATILKKNWKRKKLVNLKNKLKLELKVKLIPKDYFKLICLIKIMKEIIPRVKDLLIKIEVKFKWEIE